MKRVRHMNFMESGIGHDAREISHLTALSNIHTTPKMSQPITPSQRRPARPREPGMEKSGANFAGRGLRYRGERGRGISAATEFANPAHVALAETLGGWLRAEKRLAVRNLPEEAIGFTHLKIKALTSINLRPRFQLCEARLVGGGCRRGRRGGRGRGFLARGGELADPCAVGGELGVDARLVERLVFQGPLERGDAAVGIGERGAVAVVLPGEAGGGREGEQGEESFHIGEEMMDGL